jgi:hypothetical protein
MKTLSIFLLVSLTSLSVNAQQLVNQKDPFSGKQVKAATVTLGGPFKNIGQMLGFEEVDGKKYITFLWMPVLSGANVQAQNFDNIDIKKCSILLKMEDNSILKFKADSVLSKKNGSGQSAVLTVSAFIPDSQLELMMSHSINTIRLGLTEENVGVDLPFFTDKTRKQIQKSAAFMLNK